MKTKDLITKLQELDPSGETHIRIRGEGYDIIDFQRLPGFYDGGYEIITMNDRGFPISGVYTTDGDKIDIVTGSIDDLLWDNPHLPISFGDKVTTLDEARYDDTRRQSQEFHQASVGHPCCRYCKSPLKRRLFGFISSKCTICKRIDK